MAFQALIDIRNKLLKKESIEIVSFEGWKMDTSLGKMVLDGNSLYIDGKEFTSKEFEDLIKDLK